MAVDPRVAQDWAAQKAAERDPLNPKNLRRENRGQLLSDVLRNIGGIPEAAATMGSSLVDLAGTGLGTMAGMAKQKLAGEDIDVGAAADTATEGKFTYAPRSEAGQEFARGLGTATAPLEEGMQWAGQKTADVTGSPAAGAAVYAGLNVLDPELLAPGAAKVAALRGASSVARRGAETAVPMSEALRGVPKGQRGAYTLEDLAGVEEGPLFKSTVDAALGNLKPQEQQGMKGKQWLSATVDAKGNKKYGGALISRGAKPEEIHWSGLERFLDTDEKVTPQEIADYIAAAGPDIRQQARGMAEKTPVSPYGTDKPVAGDVPKKEPKHDYEIWGQVDTEMPSQYGTAQRYAILDSDGDVRSTYATEEEAAQAQREELVEDYRNDPANDYEELDDDGDPVDFWDLPTRRRRELANEWADEDPDDRASNYPIDLREVQGNESNTAERQARYNELRQQYADPSAPDPNAPLPPKWYPTGTPDAKQLRNPETTSDLDRSNYGENQTIFRREGRYGRGSPVDDYAARMKAKYGDQWSTQMTSNESRAMAQLQALVDNPDTAATRDFKGGEFVPHEHWPNDVNVLSFSQYVRGLKHKGQPVFEHSVQQADPFQPHDRPVYDPEAAQGPARQEWQERKAVYDEAVREATAARDAALTTAMPTFRALMDEVIALDPNAANTGNTHVDYYNYIRDRMSGRPAVNQAEYVVTGLQELESYVRRQAQRGVIEGNAAADLRQRITAASNEFNQARLQGTDVTAPLPGPDPSDPSGTVPPLPFSDPKQWARIEALQGLRQAVKKGDQYYATTTGATQSPAIWPEGLALAWEPTEGGINIAQQGQTYDPTGGENIKADLQKMLEGARNGQGRAIKYPTIPEGADDATVATTTRLQNSVLKNLAQQLDTDVETVRAMLTATPSGVRMKRSRGMSEHYDKTVPKVLENILNKDVPLVEGKKSTGSGFGVQKFAKTDYNLPIFEDKKTGRFEVPEGYTQQERIKALRDMRARVEREGQEILPEPEPQELSMGLTGAPDDWIDLLNAPQQQRLPLGKPDPAYVESQKSALAHLIEIDPELARAVLRGGFPYF